MDPVMFPPLPSGRDAADVLREVKAAGERRRWRNRALAVVPVVLVLVLAVLALGGDDGTRVLAPAGPGAGQGAMTDTSVAGRGGPPVTTAPGEPTAGVVFSTPLSLAEVRELAARNDATALAVWRTDGVCVLAVHGSGPRNWPTQDRRLSSFAYVGYEAMLSAQQGGPPATDGGWTFAVRQRFSDEWREAQADGVRFRGAAFLLRSEGARVTGREVRRVEPVPSYRSSVGVVYLSGHDEALAPLFPDTDASAC